MDLALIRREMNKQPFEPFSLRLGDGSRVHVSHSEFIAIAPPREVFVGREDGGSEILDVLHVVAIDRAEPKPRRPKGRNGPRAG